MRVQCSHAAFHWSTTSIPFLDDIDWRGRTLRVTQTKTRQSLQLPLTDEAANVLIDYLRTARPQTALRQLFLRMRAPFIP